MRPMMWHHYSGMAGYPLGGLLLIVLLFVAAAGAAAFALRGPASPPGRRDAAAILAERYARGEIDDEEYQRRRDQLSRP
ncbi:SHOCT domain-containing protein [Dactylosporangium sp. NPDC051541]|uniref:SHOCT domain-containing protein n=1 Tax=Dactylosporangium sp. NPDC051541 TaxID=3363977 RepID=UPI00378FC9EA